MEYQHRFHIEFQKLLKQQAFAEVFFRNHAVLTENKEAEHYRTLIHFFGDSFDGMALGLSRIWDERRHDPYLISIPNLVGIFKNEHFLGCRSLEHESSDRTEFETLYKDPLRLRMRVVRTEVFAHTIMVGKSKDRSKSDIIGTEEFRIVNRDAVVFCKRTLGLLLSLIDQLSFSTEWRQDKDLDQLTAEWQATHLAFLRYFVKSVS